jgi:hypothetical protein
MARTNAQRARFRLVGNIIQKRCNGCNSWKPLYQFYKANEAGKRKQVKSKCKECSKKDRIVARSGSAVNRGFVLFSTVVPHLALLMRYTETTKEAAELCGINRTQMPRYVYHPPRQIRRHTAARIILAAEKAKRKYAARS